VRRTGAALVLLALALIGGTPSEAPDPALAEREAQAVVRETMDAVIAVLKDASLSQKQQRAKTEQVAYARFDFGTISRLVLARNWKRLSEDQRSAFVVEFQRHLSLTYGKTLEGYADEEISIDRSRYEKNGDVTVRTRITGASADPYRVDYRMRGKDDSWHVIDVIIESVSLISSFRTQTREIISDVGTEGLIERLRQKNDEREAES
jgi:phospholipid transport system substrate-binding protein